MSNVRARRSVSVRAQSVALSGCGPASVATGVQRKVVALAGKQVVPWSSGLSVLRRPAHGSSVSNERVVRAIGRKVFADPAQSRSAGSQVYSGASFARAGGVGALVDEARSESRLRTGRLRILAVKGWRQLGRSDTMLARRNERSSKKAYLGIQTQTQVVLRRAGISRQAAQRGYSKSAP
jgi:hypothetical protein